MKLWFPQFKKCGRRAERLQTPTAAAVAGAVCLFWSRFIRIINIPAGCPASAIHPSELPWDLHRNLWRFNERVEQSQTPRDSRNIFIYIFWVFGFVSNFMRFNSGKAGHFATDLWFQYDFTWFIHFIYFRLFDGKFQSYLRFPGCNSPPHSFFLFLHLLHLVHLVLPPSPTPIFLIYDIISNRASFYILSMNFNSDSAWSIAGERKGKRCKYQRFIIIIISFDFFFFFSLLLLLLLYVLLFFYLLWLFIFQNEVD